MPYPDPFGALNNHPLHDQAIQPTANEHDPAAAAAVAAPSSPLQSDPFGMAIADAIADPFPVNFHPPVKVHGLPVALHRQPYEW
jgi:hypothetical protein